jgi:uncharacterized phage protein (TIGR01671 family)
MREISFRGKYVDDKGIGHWVYGFYEKSIYGSSIIDWSFVQQSYVVDVIPETVGQYTGLKDKDGEGIFEGDIIEYKTMRLPVEYSEKYACFTVDDHFWMSAHNESKVIGNIHDNPELLT